MKEKAYYEKVNVKNETLLRNLLQKMPPYCKQFFIGIEPTTSSRTRIAYAYDLKIFFHFLISQLFSLFSLSLREECFIFLGEFSPYGH